MARRRLAVALLVPGPAGAEIDGLRRAFGDAARLRVAPHITLVPPTNVPEAQAGEAQRLLRRAAASVPGPLHLGLGPVCTFANPAPVAYLAVDDDDGGVAILQQALLAPPFDRPRQHPFVPHVTVATELPPPRLAAAVVAAADFRLDVEITGVHLLEEGRDDDGARHWAPVADAALGPAQVLGRGSLPVELTVGERPDPDAAALVAAWTPPGPPARPFTVTARRDDRVVGVVAGTTKGAVSAVTSLAVAPGERGTGVGRRLLEAARAVADQRGSAWLTLEGPAGGDGSVVAFATALGFARHPEGPPAPARRP